MARPGFLSTVPLTRTKLYIPPLRSGLVSRPRLIARLDAGIRSGHKLTLISAPAGFGKTTLAAEWACSSAREVAWLSLDQEDDDPVQFLHYVIAALQQVNGSTGQTLQQVLVSPQLPPPRALITLLINDIASLGTPQTLVLDDYHLIAAPAVHQAVQSLLDHQPPALHLVISTRQDPPLSLARLRACGYVTDIGDRDLRFTADETATFLRQTVGLSLSPAIVSALGAHTEGWGAGLQLASLALQQDHGGEHVQTLIADLTAGNRYIIDYLMAEVLQRQPEHVRTFLHQTSILDRLTGPLCDAMTGRQDSQMMLERLAEANLFLKPLDHRREWFRYDRLFAEVLCATLSQKEQGRLHQGAACWYESHGHVNQAIHHALKYASAAGDIRHAEQLIRAAAEETMSRGGITTVRSWLDALPDERVRADGELATYKGWVLAVSGEMDRAQVYAQAAAACLDTARAAAPDRGRLLALCSFLALLHHQDEQAAIELATTALKALDHGQAQWSVLALWTMAEAQERTSHVTEAIATLRRARTVGRALDSCILDATVEGFLSTTLHLNGRRREAVAISEEAIQHYTDQNGRPLPMAAMLYSQLGMLYYEANQLEPARHYLDLGLALGEQLGLGSDLVFTFGRLAQVLHAQGERQAALNALQRAHQLTIQTGLVDANWPLALEVNIRLLEGDLAFGLRWAGQAGFTADDTPQYLYIEQHLAYARLLVAQGRLSDARRWLARLERLARDQGLNRWLITIHILQAIAAECSGDRPTARELLFRALHIAAPEGYSRAFLDEDRRVLALLSDVRQAAPRPVDQLLAGTDLLEQRRQASPPPLIEPLSERELEVLRLIAAGLPNREIADELVIAVGTVKRHINHIYGKLCVNSRTQAIAQARTLQILA